MAETAVTGRAGTAATEPAGSGLVDLLDRVVARGAVVSGDVVISLAGVDLIRLDLRLLLVAVDTVVAESLPPQDGRAAR
jgi:hypothetical protein